MNINEYIQVLRLQLLDMARVCQRAVDYSVKSITLGTPDFCTHAASSEYEVRQLNHDIKELCQELLATQLLVDSEIRFTLSAAHISEALRLICSETITVTKTMLPVLENGGVIGCSRLTRMADVVNALMRLCVVALGNEEAEHAKTVIETHGMIAAHEQSLHHWPEVDNPRFVAETTVGRMVTKSFWEMAKQLHHMAIAIVFWLEGSGTARPSLANSNPGELSGAESTQPLPSADDSYVEPRLAVGVNGMRYRG